MPARISRSKAGLVSAIALLMAAGMSPIASAQAQSGAAAAPAAEVAPEPLSDDELEVLVARFALYPDELVALVCAASLFPVQIVEAERFLEKRAKDKTLEPKDTWDGSVISLLNYPEVIKMMSEDLEWTQELADALTNQQKEVLIAIQQLRDEAVAKDIIKSDDKINVVQSGDNIVIQPVDSQTVYVPSYPPEMLYEPSYAPQPISYYSEPYPNYYYPSSGFWAGAVTGAVFGAVVDWDNWGVWGGNWGGDIDVDCNNCLNNINGKVNLRDVDLRNVDRSKLNIDRNQLAKFDRTNIGNGLKSDRANSIRTKGANLRNTPSGNLGGKGAQAGDIRKNVLDSSKGKQRDQARNSGQRGNDKLAGSGAGKPKAARSGSGNKAASRPAGKPKAGGRVDNRSRTPSGLGDVGRGKTAKVNSNRGRQSMGGGYHGGRSMNRGGGSRGGGAVRPRGGGGGGGGRGGGGRGGRR